MPEQKWPNPTSPSTWFWSSRTDLWIRLESVDMIRDLGFEVIEAVDADEAVSLLESVAGIEVVFTDIQMPGSMDGLLLAAVVRRWPPVALLIASGRERPLSLPTCLPARGLFQSLIRPGS